MSRVDELLGKGKLRPLEQNLEIVKAWAASRNVEFYPGIGEFHMDGEPCSPSTLGSRCWVDIGKEISERETIIAFEDYERALKREADAELRRILPLTKTSSDEHLRELLGALLDVQRKDVPVLDIVMFSQFLWQIKRKVHNLPTEWEIMPLFTGGQGFGKSRLIGRLWSAIPGFKQYVSGSQRFTVFADQFSRSIFHHCFVIPFEEMSGAAKADMEAVKSMITESEVTYRKMYDDRPLTRRNRATLYATSNLPAKASLYDATGMRRFWEFRSPNREWRNSDSERLEAIDIVKVWEAVDASQESSPVRPFRQEVAERQRLDFGKKPMIEHFLDTETRVKQESRLAVKEFYDAYRSWLKEQDARAPLRSDVDEEMKRLGYKVKNHSNRLMYCNLELINGR